MIAVVGASLVKRMRRRKSARFAAREKMTTGSSVSHCVINERPLTTYRRSAQYGLKLTSRFLHVSHLLRRMQMQKLVLLPVERVAAVPYPGRRIGDVPNMSSRVYSRLVVALYPYSNAWLDPSC